MTSSQYDTRLLPETLVSDLRHVAELLVPGFGIWCLDPGSRGLAANFRDDNRAFRQSKLTLTYRNGYYLLLQAEDVSTSLPCLWVYELMVTSRNCWVLCPRIVMVLQHLTSQLCPIVISWLLASPRTWQYSCPSDD